MILSVVVPRLQKAQWERIDDEFKGIDYEMVVQENMLAAILNAKGRFILFLEEDSAFEPTTLRESLNCFLMNPSYRKLAMVSPTVDFDDMKKPIHFGYSGTPMGFTINLPAGEDPYPTAVGYIYGAIIRTTAIQRVPLSIRKNALVKSVQTSEFMWSNGLRVEVNPTAIYYSPSSVTFGESTGPELRIKTNSEALKVWKREYIS